MYSPKHNHKDAERRTTLLLTPESEFLSQVRIPVKAVIVGFAVVGALIGIVGGTPEHVTATLPVSLLIFMLGGSAWLLAAWWETAGAWAVLFGLGVTVLLLRLGLHLQGALVLLAIPAAFGAILLGHRAGLLVALSCILLAGWLWRLGRIPLPEFILALALIGFVVLAYWIILHSIAQLVGWSWAHYLDAQGALDEARANRAQAHQTLEDLAHANRQLALMNKRLAAAQMAAEEAHKAKAAFVANVSHEFRTPLNMIIGLSDLLVEAPHVYGSDLPADLLEDLEIVRRNTQHLLAMVNDVLDLSQIEANRLALHRNQMNLAEVVEQAASVVQPLLDKKDLKLRIDLSSNLPDVYCDGARVRQVLVNLLSNATRHTEQGSVTVQVRHEDQLLTVCVSDTGPGISPEDAAHIFEPFYRGTYGALRNENGSGLGLSISKQFIEMHNGRMWVESTLGEGSRFYFSLPVTVTPPFVSGAERWLVEEWQWHERQQPAQLPQETTRPRVVICDANPDLYEACVHFNDQVEYIRVESLDAAEEELNEFSVHSMILNAPVPELLDMLNVAHQKWPDLPVIGCSLPPKLSHALAAGASGYLLKPVTRATLAAVIAQMEPTPRTVQVVDDDLDTRRLFSRMLAAIDRELRVITAASGQESLAQMSVEKPDLILLDVMLPDLDGWQVLAAKAQNDELRKIPTYLLSAQDPIDEPLSSQIIIAAAGERTPFPKLMRCAEVISQILNQPAP